MPNNKAYLNCLGREEAQGIWQKKLTEYGYFNHLPTEEIQVTKALGRVTAISVYARQSVPHYNGAAMDGIAVLAQDTFGARDTAPQKLKLLAAGQPFTLGGCFMVDTGDALPDGTNAIIMVEDIHFSDGQAEIMAAATPWQHVRMVGEDIVANELVLPEYHVIAPIDIAALLAAGLTDIEVIKKPKVAVIPTGDEIVGTHQELSAGTILDVNSHMVAAAVTEWGGAAERAAIVKDNAKLIKQTILRYLPISDMVIVSAGTSAGREDFTADVLAELGEVLVHGVSIKPGKPVVLAVCQGKPVIGLPGYPVSTMLTAELFVRDILLLRQKLPNVNAESVTAMLSKQVPSSIGVEEYIRVSVGNVQGRMLAAPLSRGAALISSLTKAQGIIRINKETAGLNEGEQVPVFLFNQEHTEDTLLAIGSHDLALELLGVFLRRRSEKKIGLACANVGSMGGLIAIRNNEAHIAGIHMLDDKTGCYNTSFVKKYLSKGYKLVHLAMREQGLMVKRGNPQNITGLASLTRSGVNFINRQRGSGTRMLLDYECNKMNINYEAIQGYDKEVATHMAVAATVAAGVADTGLGVRAAARALDLDFISVAEEQYDLLLNFADGDSRESLVIDILKDPIFRKEVESWGGYDLNQAGTVVDCQLLE